MQYTAQILEDGTDQIILLPECCRVDTSEVWITLDEATGIITLSPKLSETNEISEAQRQRDRQTMIEMIAAKRKDDTDSAAGPAR